MLLIVKILILLTTLKETTDGLTKLPTVHDSLSILEDVLTSQAAIIRDVEHFKEFLDEENTSEKNISLINDFIRRCRREDEIARQVGRSEYLSNPINAFTLITRMTKDLSKVETILENTGYIREAVVTPSRADLEGALVGMTRLQILYDLNPRHLANGTLVSRFANKGGVIEHVSPMTASDCFELGLVEYEKGNNSRNVDWMMAALRSLRQNPASVGNEFTEPEILDYLAGANYNAGNYESAIYWLQESMALTPFNPQNKERTEFLKHMQQKLNAARQEKMEKIQKPECGLPDLTYMKMKNKKSKAKIQESAFPGLCLKKTKYDTTLRCFYKSGPSTFLKLAPLKTEILKKSPRVAMYHDVISDGEIEYLKNFARPRLQSARDPNSNRNETGCSYYVHKISFIADSWSQTVARLSRRISTITDLSVDKDTAEEMYVSNYGIGGFYGPHYDFMTKINSTTEKTFATIIFYLSNVSHGGATIFTDLDLTVYPKKNSALFWTNLDPWGRVDWRTQHAACLVLRGNRWVAGKWIYLKGQELRKKCPRRPPDERSQVQKN